MMELAERARQANRVGSV